MGDSNLSIYSAAKDSYCELLSLRLSPMIFEGIVSIYEDAVTIENNSNEFGGNIMIQFQVLLKAVQKWNQNIIEEETKRIMDEIPCLMELVGAIFISYIKILACIRIGNDSAANIKLKIPSADVFIHNVYKQVAETFYYNPFYFKNYKNREHFEAIMNAISKNINDTINLMIPVDSILKEYITKLFKNKQSLNSQTYFKEQDDDIKSVLSSIMSSQSSKKSDVESFKDLFKSDEDDVFNKSEKSTIDDIFTSPKFSDTDKASSVASSEFEPTKSVTFKDDIDDIFKSSKSFGGSFSEEKPSFSENKPSFSFPSFDKPDKPSFSEDKPSFSFPSFDKPEKPLFSEDKPSFSFPSFEKPSFTEEKPILPSISEDKPSITEEKPSFPSFSEEKLPSFEQPSFDLLDKPPISDDPFKTDSFKPVDTNEDPLKDLFGKTGNDVTNFF